MQCTKGLLAAAKVQPLDEERVDPKSEFPVSVKQFYLNSDSLLRQLTYSAVYTAHSEGVVWNWDTLK